MLLQEALLDKSIEFNDVIAGTYTSAGCGTDTHGTGVSCLYDGKLCVTSEGSKWLSNLKSVNMGATAVGTGINTDERYKRICVKASV